MIKEYLLTTDKFLNPKVLSGMDAIGVLLIRLLLTDPGSNPLHPAMGVGLGTKYRFIMETSLSELQRVIEDQIATYCPPTFQSCNVILTIDEEKCLVVSIIINQTQFVLETKNISTPVRISDIIN